MNYNRICRYDGSPAKDNGHCSQCGEFSPSGVYGPNTVERFVITHLNANGLRRLAFAQQGRYTYDTRDAADEALEVFRGPQGLPRVLAPFELTSLRVDPVECYAHGDPCRYYVDEVQS